MKLFYLICFLTLSGVLQANTLVGQDLNKVFVSLELKNTSLKETLKQIERNTKIRFTYKSEDIAGFKQINFHKSNQKLVEVLDELFKGSNLTYEEISTNVLIIKKTHDAELQQAAEPAPPVVLKGKVTDEKGLPVPGVNVLIKGTSNGTVTARDGSFTLTAQQNTGTLVISFIGYIKQEISFSGAGNYNVSLVTDAKGLNEVVVIGYGTTTKKDLTASVGQVKMDDLVKAPVFTFTEALAGRVAGVQVSTSDGQPGSAQDIVIRGSGSLTQSTAPLYVIDGFAMESFQSNSLNPDDIESITVLKDASGTAVYGARGANGVVVIQTKKGKAGKPVITLNTSLGIQELRKQMEMMSPYEFVKMQSEMINTALVNQVYFPNGKTLESYRNVAGVNWQDLIFRRGTMQTHNFAIRGGSEHTRYSVSGVVNDQEGLMINSGYNRALARVSLDQDVSEKLKVGFNANYSSATSFGLGAASSTGTASISNYIFANVYGYRPVSANENVNLEEELFDPDVAVNSSNVRINPVITAENTYRKTINNEIVGNAYLTYNFIKELAFNSRTGYRKRVVRGEAFYNSLTPQGSASPVNTRGVNGNFSFAENNTWTNENTLTYQKTFKEDHKLTALAGFSLEGVATNTYGATSQFVPNEQLGMLGLDEGTPLAITASGGDNKLMSFFSRVDYNYKSKYLLTLVARADGSSKFRPENQWGYFPSAAFAWNMTAESFMKSVPFISNSKLRLSHGLSGNNRIGNYETYNRISFDKIVNGVSFNDSPQQSSAWLSELGNTDLKWETSITSNIGYDLGLFKNRIELTAELYRKTTDNLLLDAQIPYISGYSNTTKNIGKIKNEGLEFALNTVNINTDSFRWESNFNISFNRSKILELTESSTLFSDVSGGFSPAPALWIAKVGQPISVFHGYVFDGVYQYEDFNNPVPGLYSLKLDRPTNGNSRAAIQPGDIKYKDLNGDGIVNGFDQMVIGRAEPIHTGGFSNNFSYKGLSLNVFFQWSAGNDIFNGNRLVFEGNSQYAYHLNQFASWADRWSPENPSNKNFRVGGQGPTAYGSSRVIEDGSYLRLKTVSLAYQIPSRFISKLYLKSLSVQASAQNLVTWTNYSGLDPEVSVKSSALTRGFDYSAYPHAQTIVFGLNATF
ncbi:SusC/RagA family TonB-linked outer membrane protein [Pedobacter africanus]|uniref:TonB-linked SusC/RagA family outer membrane protein n=1 Tax=Pedobacter africanus TaxID=151894 RepID=A0ACC6KV59_9SPHI|nr:SusC/RagA family TonB-linked outer membrane protein [Pedobacter africanus]MDR6783250.1 TonB-linked SusC/RagA family outer membrane protein [Pedobacter africanus]